MHSSRGLRWSLVCVEQFDICQFMTALSCKTGRRDKYATSKLWRRLSGLQETPETVVDVHLSELVRLNSLLRLFFLRPTVFAYQASNLLACIETRFSTSSILRR